MVFFISKGEAWLVYSIEGVRAVDRQMVESYSRYDSHQENLIKLSTSDHLGQTAQFSSRWTNWNRIRIPTKELNRSSMPDCLSRTIQIDVRPAVKRPLGSILNSGMNVGSRIKVPDLRRIEFKELISKLVMINRLWSFITRSSRLSKRTMLDVTKLKVSSRWIKTYQCKAHAIHPLPGYILYNKKAFL